MHIHSWFLLNDMILMLQHSYVSFLLFRPHIRGIRWSTRWSRTLWRGRSQTWRSWGERAKARTLTSTRTRRARWDGPRNPHRHLTHTWMLSLWHTNTHACSYVHRHNYTNTHSLTNLDTWDTDVDASVTVVGDNVWRVWSVHSCRGGSVFVVGFFCPSLEYARMQSSPLPVFSTRIHTMTTHTHKEGSKQEKC